VEEILMIASVLSLLLAQAPATPPSPLWDKLRARLQDADQRLDGVLSVSVEDLATGGTIEIRAGEAFATASCIKPAVLLELYHAAAGGEVDLQQVVPAPSPRVGGGGPLELLGPAARLTWRDLAVLMMSYSDNDAANALIDRLGMEAVNARAQRLGLASTRLRRRMMDAAAAREGRENVSTAADLRGLMKALRAADGLPPALADDMRAVASGPKRSEFEVALAGDPRALAKTGILEGLRCWTAVVELPHRPFAAAVLVGHLRDEAQGEAAVGAIANDILATFQRLAQDSEYGRAGMR
jgi:beta-lactamase class A